MGGMTGIALASLFPDAVSRLAVTACTAKTTPVRKMPIAIPLASYTQFNHLHLVLGFSVGNSGTTTCSTSSYSGRSVVLGR